MPHRNLGKLTGNGHKGNFQSDGNIIYYPKFCTEAYVNENKEFVFPNSAITIDILNPISTNSVVIKFNLSESANINEIVILGAN